MAATVDLRRATWDDAALLFEWRNDPEIVRLGKSQQPVDWDQHTNWLGKVLDADDHLVFKIMVDGVAAGQIRFDRRTPHTVEVSIYLLAQFRQQGIGTTALRAGASSAFAQFRGCDIAAIVMAENEQSIRFFESAGFQRSSSGPDDSLVALTLRPVPHNRLTIDSHHAAAVADTVSSGQWTAGPKTDALETQLAELAGVKTATCVSSGFAALRLALLALGVRPGDGVIVPAYSCVALANAVLACGAHPIPVDVSHESWVLDSEAVGDAAAMHRPSAIIAVNMFGAPAPIEELRPLNIPIIEDCAHAFGMTIGSKPFGGRGDIAVMSFHATKLIAAGEGGAILSNAAEHARFCESFRDYADQPPDGRRFNDQMTDIEATLALCQLRELQEMIARRAQCAERYVQRLGQANSAAGSFRLPRTDATRIWYRFVVDLNEIPAAAVINEMAAYGVVAAQPVDNWLAADPGSFPVAEHGYGQALSLPLYPSLSDRELDRVVEAFVQSIERLAA